MATALTATPEPVASGGLTDLVGFLHQVDLVELQDDGKVDGLLAHSTRLLVEVHLLEDLTGRHRRPSVWEKCQSKWRYFFFLLANIDSKIEYLKNTHHFFWFVFMAAS